VCESARFGMIGASVPVDEVEERAVLVTVADRWGKKEDR